MKRGDGFTLIELMIVVAIIAIIAAIAIPSLLNARKASNEASCISSLRTLSTVNQQYHTRYQSFASSMDDLRNSGYIDSVLGSGTKSGYAFTYAGSTNTWTTSATPSTAGTTGDRGFFIGDSGSIRFVATGTATSASPPLD